MRSLQGGGAQTMKWRNLLMPKEVVRDDATATHDHRALHRGAARARLRPDARQRAASHAALVHPGRGGDGGAHQGRAARAVEHSRRHGGCHRHRAQPEAAGRGHAQRRAQVPQAAREQAGPDHGRRHRAPTPTSRSSTRISSSARRRKRSKSRWTSWSATAAATCPARATTSATTTSA